MKKTISLLALIFGIAIISNAQQIQEVTFEYDDAGNRESVTVIPMGSGGSDEYDQEEKVFEKQLGEQSIKIYPNPTRGNLSVKIDNMEDVSTSSIAVYNSVGVMVKQLQEVTDYNDVNISEQPNGVYFMVITIGDKKTKWKIVKQ